LLVAERAVRVLGADGYRDAKSGDALSPDKVISETALLLVASATSAREDASLGHAHDQLALGLIPHARSPRVRAAVCLRPAHANELAFAHSCLRHLGYPESALDQLLAAALRAEAIATERPPHRELEQEWIRRLLGQSSIFSAGLLRRSMLGQRMDALASSRDDIYAFTHAVMYATDLGRREPEHGRRFRPMRKRRWPTASTRTTTTWPARSF